MYIKKWEVAVNRWKMPWGNWGRCTGWVPRWHKCRWRLQLNVKNDYIENWKIQSATSATEMYLWLTTTLSCCWTPLSLLRIYLWDQKSIMCSSVWGLDSTIEKGLQGTMLWQPTTLPLTGHGSLQSKLNGKNAVYQMKDILATWTAGWVCIRSFLLDSGGSAVCVVDFVRPAAIKSKWADTVAQKKSMYICKHRCYWYQDGMNMTVSMSQRQMLMSQSDCDFVLCVWSANQNGPLSREKGLFSFIIIDMKDVGSLRV